MIGNLSKFLDKLSEFLSQRKGLLPLLGIVLILINFLLKLIIHGWITDTDLLLHIGIIISIVGILIAWAL